MPWIKSLHRPLRGKATNALAYQKATWNNTSTSITRQQKERNELSHCLIKINVKRLLLIVRPKLCLFLFFILLMVSCTVEVELTDKILFSATKIMFSRLFFFNNIIVVESMTNLTIRISISQEMNCNSSPLANITNTADARQNTKNFNNNTNKRQLSLDGFLVNKKQKTSADETILLSPNTKDQVKFIQVNYYYTELFEATTRINLY